MREPLRRDRAAALARTPAGDTAADAGVAQALVRLRKEVVFDRLLARMEASRSEEADLAPFDDPTGEKSTAVEGSLGSCETTGG